MKVVLKTKLCQKFNTKGSIFLGKSVCTWDIVYKFLINSCNSYTTLTGL
jgi:hypothetical protein